MDSATANAMKEREFAQNMAERQREFNQNQSNWQKQFDYQKGQGTWQNLGSLGALAFKAPGMIKGLRSMWGEKEAVPDGSSSAAPASMMGSGAGPRFEGVTGRSFTEAVPPGWDQKGIPGVDLNQYFAGMGGDYGGFSGGDVYAGDYGGTGGDWQSQGMGPGYDATNTFDPGPVGNFADNQFADFSSFYTG
jgi:hypothetical protein